MNCQRCITSHVNVGEKINLKHPLSLKDRIVKKFAGYDLFWDGFLKDLIKIKQ